MTMPPENSKPPRPLRALFVADDPEDLKLMVGTLEQAGYSLAFTSVETPELLRKQLADADYDVVLSDYNLRDWTGLEALELVKASGKAIPFIVVSGSLGEQAAVECITLGASEYVLKNSLSRLGVAVSLAIERKRIEEKCRVQVMALEAAANSIVITDRRGVILWVNPAFTRASGYSADDVIGQNPEILHSGKHDLSFYQRVWASVESGQVWRGEVVGRRKDGSLYDENMTITPVINERGEVTHCIAIKEDITDRKRAVEALQQSEDRYRDLVEHSQDLICTHDLDGHLLSVNPTAAKIVGYEPAEMRGMNIRDGLAPQVRHEFDEYITTIREKGAAQGLMLVQTRAGEKRVWEYRNTLRTEGVATPVVRGMAHDITERRQAEQALRLSEEHYRDLVEHAPDAIFIADARLRFVQANTRACEISGYTCEELLEMSIPDFMPPDDLASSPLRIEQLRQGQIVVAERRCRRKDGTLIPVEVSSKLLRDGRLQAIVRDITERTRADRSLRDSERRYRLLFDESPFPMWVFDRETLKFLTVNNAAVRQYGYSRSEFLSMRITDLQSPGEGSGLLSEPGKPPARHAVHHRRKDGGLIDVEITRHELKLNGRSAAMVIAIDVSERKVAETALGESEGKYRELVENATYGIFRSDPEGRFLDVNPALVAMLGYESKEELLARNLVHDIYEIPGERAEAIGKYSFTNITADIVNWKRKDGKTIVVRLSGRKLHGEGGQLKAYEVIVEDVTEQRAMEAQFRQAQKMDAVGRLAGGVAHDFNNLLMVISSYAELMAARPLDDQSLKYVGQILSATSKAASVTRQLLAFSRKQILEPTVLDLNILVISLGGMLRRLLGEDVEMVLSTSPEPARVKADRGQMEQVLMNLALNARDAMPEGGRLIIEVSNVDLDAGYAQTHTQVTPGRYALLAVTDTGSGMDQETQAHIFEPFFTTKEKGKGTGLGLATAYGIIKQSDGFIWVYSEVGKGSCFKIYLPAVEDATFVEKTESRPTSPGGAETILLVEDEEGLRLAVREFLRSKGYKVLDAGNGADALHIAEEHVGTIHLLVTDMVLPGGSGTDLARRILEKHPGTRVILMSGYTDRSIDRRAIGPDAVFLQKPFSLETLNEKLRTALGQSQSAPIVERRSTET